MWTRITDPQSESSRVLGTALNLVNVACLARSTCWCCAYFGDKVCLPFYYSFNKQVRLFLELCYLLPKGGVEVLHDCNKGPKCANLHLAAGFLVCSKDSLIPSLLFGIPN